MAIDEGDNRLSHLHDELSLQESHTHLNAVCRSRDRTYVLLNRQGLLVQIGPT
jgi:hypothetical protein